MKIIALILVVGILVVGCGASAQVPTTITLDVETVACVTQCLDQGITDTASILNKCPMIPDALLADLELVINAIALKKGVVRKSVDAGVEKAN